MAGARTRIVVRPFVAGLVPPDRPDAEPDAPTRAMAAARSFNAIIEDALTPEETARVKAVTATPEVRAA